MAKKAEIEKAEEFWKQFQDTYFGHLHKSHQKHATTAVALFVKALRENMPGILTSAHGRKMTASFKVGINDTGDDTQLDGRISWSDPHGRKYECDSSESAAQMLMIFDASEVDKEPIKPNFSGGSEADEAGTAEAAAEG